MHAYHHAQLDCKYCLYTHNNIIAHTASILLVLILYIPSAAIREVILTLHCYTASAASTYTVHIASTYCIHEFMPRPCLHLISTPRATIHIPRPVTRPLVGKRLRNGSELLRLGLYKSVSEGGNTWFFQISC